eukprot:1072024-Rhodomonas_salina.1
MTFTYDVQLGTADPNGCRTGGVVEEGKEDVAHVEVHEIGGVARDDGGEGRGEDVLEVGDGE